MVSVRRCSQHVIVLKLLCIWNKEAFKVEKKLRGSGVIYLEGTRATNGAKVIIKTFTRLVIQF